MRRAHAGWREEAHRAGSTRVDDARRFGQWLWEHPDRDDALKEYQNAVRESANLELPGYRKKNDPLWFREEYDSENDDLGDMDYSKENINSILRDGIRVLYRHTRHRRRGWVS